MGVVITGKTGDQSIRDLAPVEIRNSPKIWSALVWNMHNRSQINFAHLTTMQLSWCVQNFVVIGTVYFKPEHGKFWANFEFDRNAVSGTGAYITWRWPDILLVSWLIFRAISLELDIKSW